MRANPISISIFVALTGLAAACAPPPSYIRFTTATEAQLTAVEREGVAWYEFQPGDEVPLNVGVLGATEALAEDVKMVAKRRFFIVLRRGFPPALSFDGEFIQSGSETFLAFGREDDKNSLSLITYVGLPADMPEKLKQVGQ